jgi:hypothetical protein
MELYFSLHDIRDDETKLHVGVLNLDQEIWQWWQWHKKFYPSLPTWTMFTKVVYARFDKESHFLGQIIKLKQTGYVIDFIIAFEQLPIHIEGLSDDFYLECFISSLKDTIKAQVSMHHLITWLHHLVTGVSISQGSGDHSSGPTPAHCSSQSSSPKGYISFDTNIEIPKGISSKNGGTSQARTFLLL